MFKISDQVTLNRKGLKQNTTRQQITGKITQFINQAKIPTQNIKLVAIDWRYPIAHLEYNNHKHALISLNYLKQVKKK